MKVKSIETGPLAHWATRLSGKAESLPIEVKTLKTSATNLEEAAAITLASQLLVGKAPKALQETFDKISGKLVADFNKAKPDYKFVKGGRPKGSKNPVKEAPTKKSKKAA